MDHIEVSAKDVSRKKEKISLSILDRATQVLRSFPCVGKTAEETKRCLRLFLGPGVEPKHIYSDNSLEIAKACEDLGWAGKHDTSTPNRSETNGVIERANRRAENGCSADLTQSGMYISWWGDAMKCDCFFTK